MARRCDICGKGSHVGMTVSHSNIHTKRRWRPNIHRVRVMVNGTPRRVYACTRCLRNLRKA